MADDEDRTAERASMVGEAGRRMDHHLRCPDGNGTVPLDRERPVAARPLGGRRRAGGNARRRRREYDDDPRLRFPEAALRSEEHTSELQSLMRISYAVFCLKKKNNTS